jgi:hypothetical protein
MPPVIILVVGAVGAVAAIRWIGREARRINAELHPERYGAVAEPEKHEQIGRLRRDRSGVFRPD